MAKKTTRSTRKSKTDEYYLFVLQFTLFMSAISVFFILFLPYPMYLFFFVPFISMFGTFIVTLIQYYERKH